jgi:predicted amidohydrolase
MKAQTVRVAVAQYGVEQTRDWNAYQSKIERWVSEAAGHKARLAVFPEYAAMELVSVVDGRSGIDRRLERHTMGSLLLPAPDRRQDASLRYETAVVNSLLESFLTLHATLSKKHDLYMLAGSFPVEISPGVIRNRAYLFTPEGSVGFQDKIVLTRWEREVWGISGGDEIKVFDTSFGPVGIAICYDVEFPLIARIQAETGARVMMAPCCAESQRGYYRVQVGSRARALENQVYVLQSPTICSVPMPASLQTCVGAAGIYAPPDLGPNVDGVVAQGPFGVSKWVVAELDLAVLERIRISGRMANELDWAEQAQIPQAIAGSFQPIA